MVPIDPASLQQRLHRDIPLARAMDVRVGDWDGTVLALAAPLAPNRNDKGSAFGGSLASLMTLAGWGAAVLALQRDEAEIYVQDSRVDYLVPVWEDLAVSARLDADGDGFRAAYAARGRARVQVRAQCRLADGRVAATLQARFVALDPARVPQRRGDGGVDPTD